MSTFASVWAVKSATTVNAGDIVPVILKNGGVKNVVVDKYLYTEQDRYGDEWHFYLPAQRK